MADMALIGGLASSTKAALDIVKGLVGMRDEVMIAARVRELLRLLIEADEKVHALQKAIAALEQREIEQQRAIDELRGRRADLDQYELAEIAPGRFAMKPRQQGGEQRIDHLLCQNCYERAEKSILQRDDFAGEPALQCNRCRARIMLEP